MKKVLILCRRETQANYDQIDTLTTALSSIDAQNEYDLYTFEELVFHYDGRRLTVYAGEIDIADYDGVFMFGWFKTKILEDIALSAATYMRSKGKFVLNSEVLHTRSRSKLSQYVYAAINDIRMTPFLFAKDASVALQAFKTLWSKDYPVILKGVQSNRGNDNYCINTEPEAITLLDSMRDDEGPWFVFQGFVPNKGDYRIIVMGDEVKYVIHRKAVSGDSHLNNTSKGGIALDVAPDTLPPEPLEKSVKLAKLLKREVTGVDMIQHIATGEFYLLEVNNMPQLATGSFVTEKMKALDSYLAKIS